MFNEIRDYLNTTSWQKITCNILLAVFVVFIIIVILDMSAVFNVAYDVSR